MCNDESTNRLSDFFRNIKVTEQQQSEQCKQVKDKEVFNKMFWDYNFIITGQKIAYKVSDSFYGYFIKQESTEYHVGCTLPKTGELFDDEYDRCEYAIALYSKVYDKEIFDDEINEVDLKKGIRNFKFQDNKSIRVSGDIDFNFKMKHVRYLMDIIDHAESEMADTEKRDLRNKLIGFHNLTYHPNNISLLPRTGALNNIKKSLGNDRLDTFLFALKIYYEKEITSFILSGAGGMNPPFIANRNKLKEFLNSFKCGNNNSESIYNYCKQMYHIEKDLVDELCLSGSKPIDTPERVNEYLDLATEFWRQKQKFYNEKAESEYQIMVKMVVEANGLIYFNSFTGR